MVVHESQTWFDIFFDFGTFFLRLLHFQDLFYLIPSALIIFPRTVISLWMMLHFFGFSFNLYFLNLLSTLVKLSEWSTKFLPNTMTSAKYARHYFQVYPFSTSCHDIQVIIWRFQQPMSYLNFVWIFDTSLLGVLVIVFLNSFFPVLQLDVTFSFYWFWLYTCQIYLYQ